MQIIAHRGHGSQPENTMRAFRKGHEVGADRIEFDIQKTADGDYVVIHDPTVDRTTNGKGKVSSFHTADIEKLDAGQGERLPLFSQVIDWAVSNNVALDIEVKHPENGDEVALAQTVRQSGLRDPWVMSFDGDFVERFERLAPEVTTAVLVHEKPLKNNAIAGAKVGGLLGLAGMGAALMAGASALPAVGGLLAGVMGGAATGYGLTLHHLRRRDLTREADLVIPGQRIINKKMIERAHQAGKQIGVYTVDDADKGRQLNQQGLDVLISNWPERHLT
ncbi:MAG: glycerophosphodiester phosphodiesterase family protein [Vulcanimicrobiota bacterium]